MTLVEQSLGGYVTTRGGNENIVTGTLSSVPGATYVGQQWVGGLMIVLFIMFLVSMQMGYVQCMMEQDDGFENNPATARFYTGDSQKSGFANEYLANKLNDRNQSAFMNSRETPYHNGPTQRELAMENRERSAVRALAKINQERRSKLDALAAAEAAESGVSKPLNWGPFWNEWKSNNPLDGEDTTGYSSNMEYRSVDGW